MRSRLRRVSYLGCTTIPCRECASTAVEVTKSAAIASSAGRWARIQASVSASSR